MEFAEPTKKEIPKKLVVRMSENSARKHVGCPDQITTYSN